MVQSRSEELLAGGSLCNQSIDLGVKPASGLLPTQLKLIMKVHECQWIFMVIHGLKGGFSMIIHKKTSMFLNMEMHRRGSHLGSSGHRV